MHLVPVTGRPAEFRIGVNLPLPAGAVVLQSRFFYAFVSRSRPSQAWLRRGRALHDNELDHLDNVEAARTRFARLVMPYLPDAYALARSITGNRADAEDVVQEACLRAFRAIGATAINNSRAWLLTIVHNTAYSWLAKNRPAAMIGVDDLEAVEQAQTNSSAPDDQTPEAAIIARADGAHLAAAIQQLPAPLRETLMLRDVDGLSYRDIAQVTGIPIGTVMSRLARARARLIIAIGRIAS
jgi:RNA polymerase sigma factor (sigma-70 family)